MDDEAALRRLTEKGYGTAETTAEALAQLELELEKARRWARPGAMSLGWGRCLNRASGEVWVALEQLSSPEGGAKVYGLTYPGHFEVPSWCYLTIGDGVMIASQPSNGDCGTSLTNVWSAEFID